MLIVWVRHIGCLLAFFLLASASRPVALAEERKSHAQLYQRTFADTYAGLECMRAGAPLIADRVEVLPVRPGQDPCPVIRRAAGTSPTNIALDLLVQLEALRIPRFRDQARFNISRTLRTLSGLKRHAGTGLFHNRYTTGEAGHDPEVVDFYLSAIDNLHLAFSLWVTARRGPSESRALSARLFKSIHLTCFHDTADGLFHGGAHYENGLPVIESWKYRYLGSEGRSLYAIGMALGLIPDRSASDRALDHMDAEVFLTPDSREELLGLWDGGAFQLLLPRLLISEERYLPKLGSMFRAYGKLVLSEGIRQGFPMPASHSAGEFAPWIYNGKSGTPMLVASDNADLRDPVLRSTWDSVVTPHAVFLAAPLMPEKFSEAMTQAEDISDGIDDLYRPGLGWMDGLHVKGPLKGEVVPILLSLDQEMIALSSAQVLARDGMTEGARALDQNEKTRSRLRSFYGRMKQRLDLAPRRILGTD